MSAIRLAMIGCGAISDRFFRQAAAIGRHEVEVVATCARRIESAQQKAAKYSVPEWFDDFEQMMDKATPQAVVVTTPHSLHAVAVVAALRRGIHVLNEKPMATRFEDCQEMTRLAQERNLTLMQLPFESTPVFLTALEYLNEEFLGKFTGAESTLMLPAPGGRASWYFDRSIAHGGAMLDCTVYPASRLVSLLGPAASVTAHVNTLIPHRIVRGDTRIDSDVDDNVSIILEWATGQQATLRTLWATSFSGFETAIYGRKGTLWISSPPVPKLVLHTPGRVLDGGESIEFHGVPNCQKIPPSPKYANQSVIEHFVSAIRSGRPPNCSAELQLHTHEILFKAYQSAETGRRQSLSTSFELWHPVDRSFYDTSSGFV